MSSHDPSSATAADAVAGGSYRVCDTVVLVCLAFASSIIVFTVAVCFRRAVTLQGYAASASASPSGRGGAAAAPLLSAACAGWRRPRSPRSPVAYRRGCGRRRRVGAVRDLPRRGARRRGRAAAAGVQAPVPRGVRRHVAVLARHVPALPARRRRRRRRGRRQSLAAGAMDRAPQIWQV